MIDVDRNGVDELLVYTHQIGTDGELTLTDCYFTDDSTGEVCWYKSNVGLWSDDKTEATEEEAMAFFEFEVMFIPNELEV